MENTENSCRITYIYGLYEVGKEDEIRYIGKTVNIECRLRCHIKPRKKSSNQQKNEWIKSVISNGGEIGIKIIEECEDNWDLREKYWISEYKNYSKLLNILNGGQSGKMYNISYKDCVAWVRENCVGIDTLEKWKRFEKPDFIPEYPPRVFPEFKTWGEFFGTNKKHNIEQTRTYLSHEDAIIYLKDKGIKSMSDWKKKYECGEIPNNLFPKRPYRFYKKRGWISWGNFLSTGNVQNGKIDYVSYDDCKKFAKNNNIKSQSQWRKFKNKPTNIPKAPHLFYTNWNSWLDFFDRTDHNIKREFLSYEESKIVLIKNDIKSYVEFKKFIKNRSRELKIPSHPSEYYKCWVGWDDFLNKR